MYSTLATALASLAPVLPGRNGLGVSLTLFYNSRIWTFDQWDNVTFNADRDFPGYGFRLGFGYLESFNNGQNYLLTEPDGTKWQMRLKSGTTNVLETYDSSNIDYNKGTKILRRKNGTQWLYEAGVTTNIFRPKQITDTNGNYITISYKTDPGFKDQAINQIVDTLGRTIVEYDGPTCSLWDSGTIWITVDTFTASTLYGRFST